MNFDIIKRVVADQKEELNFKKQENLILRDIHSYTNDFLDEPVIKVITGVIRCGKSTFSHQLLEDKHYGFLNFDDERLYSIKTEDLNDILEVILSEYNNPDYLLFDEIQNIDGWELFANRLMRQGFNLILTGSNSKMLSRELATHLTGRHVQIELYPFSFNEFLKYNELSDLNKSNPSTREIAMIKNLLNDYTELGGFPEVRKLTNKKRYLRDLFDKIVQRDIVQRYKIRQISAFKELSVVMLNYFSSLFSFNKLKNSLNFNSINTVKDFLYYLEETYLLSYINRHSFKIREEIRSPRKVYSIDPGMITAMSTSMNPDRGKKIENLVFLHEKRKGNDLTYYQNGNSEVDFVSKDRENRIALIQVASDISDQTTYEREIKALMNARDVFTNAELLLITENNEDTKQIDGKNIQIIPLWKYLLNN